MSDTPVQLLVAAFKTEDGAQNALNELKQAKKDDLIKILNAAIITMNAKGKVKIHETGDMGGGKGAVIGAAIGTIVPGIGNVVGGVVGAALGGMAAKMRDSGFPNDRLAKIGEGLKPGTSAIVAVIEHVWVAQLETAMQEAGADVITEAISDDINKTLSAGGEVGYSALAANGSLEVSRLETHEE
jgi:uncharacterized membrane protein